MRFRKLRYEEVLRQRRTTNDALGADRRPIVGVLEDIRSMYNVGSCFRTADAFLLDRLVLTGYTPHPPRKEISKTALGADQAVPWRHYDDRQEALSELKTDGYRIVALELAENATPLQSLGSDFRDADARIALLVGNEIGGVSQDSLSMCDDAVSIPMLGVKHSLNVAVAFGVGMWELVRRIEN